MVKFSSRQMAIGLAAAVPNPFARFSNRWSRLSTAQGGSNQFVPLAAKHAHFSVASAELFDENRVYLHFDVVHINSLGFIPPARPSSDQ
jgi:hypothetical protein